MPPPLRLAGLRTSSFTCDLGVSGVDVPREEDEETVLLGAQRFGGVAGAVNEDERT